MPGLELACLCEHFPKYKCPTHLQRPSRIRMVCQCFKSIICTAFCPFRAASPPPTPCDVIFRNQNLAAFAAP
eukprot:UN16287